MSRGRAPRGPSPGPPPGLAQSARTASGRRSESRCPSPPRASNSRIRSSSRAVPASRCADSTAISSPSRSSSANRFPSASTGCAECCMASVLLHATVHPGSGGPEERPRRATASYGTNFGGSRRGRALVDRSEALGSDSWGAVARQLRQSAEAVKRKISPAARTGSSVRWRVSPSATTECRLDHPLGGHGSYRGRGRATGDDRPCGGGSSSLRRPELSSWPRPASRARA